MLRGLGEESRTPEAASERDQEEPQLRARPRPGGRALAAAETALRQATTALAEARAEQRPPREREDAIGRPHRAVRNANGATSSSNWRDLEAESGGEAKLTELKAEAARLAAQMQETESELLAAEIAEEDG